MQTINFRLAGQSPLIVHSNVTVDPLNEYTLAIKRITSKGSKKLTDEDHAALYELKWRAALYYAADIGPYLPADNVLKALREGASMASRKGKDIERGVNILEDRLPLIYKGPREPEALYKDPKFVFIKAVKPNKTGGTVMSARPIFPEWAVTATVIYAPSVINRETIIEAMTTAGGLVGCGNWRPRFGRFAVEVLK